ncbi:hypothetical protein HPB47_027775 [Ixodes persulcatus]|uniref:Uncharacterized protein n=1 Tax=Ixodes persulcatus TaxID=34615 RepID=A0AC60PWA7_IXOPE|nr:hypothetical protein HPB47_027775 [Ixodes persulcatus]
MLLSGHLALVTGAGSGIGRCVCVALAADGAIVVAADLNLENATKTINMLPGPEVHMALPVDVSDSVSVAALFDKIKTRCHVPLSIVVNSAGLSRTAEFINTSEELFDTLIAVNLKGTFLVSQLAARTMISGKTSNCAIVNIGSVVAKSGLINNSAYVASKAGVTGLTKSMALELASAGIRAEGSDAGFFEPTLLVFGQGDVSEPVPGLSAGASSRAGPGPGPIRGESLRAGPGSALQQLASSTIPRSSTATSRLSIEGLGSDWLCGPSEGYAARTGVIPDLH